MVGLGSGSQRFQKNFQENKKLSLPQIAKLTRQKDNNIYSNE